MPKLTGALAIGVRASRVLEGMTRGVAAAGLELRSARLEVRPDATAWELLQSMGTIAGQLSGRGDLLILVDGYSDRSVRTARLFLEMWDPGSRASVFMLPPLPNEKRLEGRFRFNVGLMANWLDVDGLLIDVRLDDSLSSSSGEELESAALSSVSAVLLDLVGRYDRPPVSELLEDGGNYLLLIGGFRSARELALMGALEGAPSVAVAASAPASELVLAASLAQAFGVGVDTASGSVSYVIMRREDMREEDPIYAALRSSPRGPPPALDFSPTMPAKVELPLDLYEL
ncbi:MAG: hypothetical protein ACP5NG_03595 [Conexivisphaera sp.]